jgi:hypothetical protein
MSPDEASSEPALPLSHNLHLCAPHVGDDCADLDVGGQLAAGVRDAVHGQAQDHEARPRHGLAELRGDDVDRRAGVRGARGAGVWIEAAYLVRRSPRP